MSYDDLFDPEAVTDILAEPRYAYLQFELTVCGHEADGHQSDTDSIFQGFTAEEFAGQLEDPPDTLSEDLAALADLGVVDTMSGTPPQYLSRGYQLYPQDGISFPDGWSVSHLSPPLLGVVGYGYRDGAVMDFLDEYDYSYLALLTNAYRDRLTGETDPDTPLEHQYPDVDEADIRAVQPALEYAFRRLDTDPLWDATYSVDEERLSA